MAKKKYTTYGEQRLDEVQNYAETKKEFVDEVITPAIEEHLLEKVRLYRSQGYNENQIASILSINKFILEKIK